MIKLVFCVRKQSHLSMDDFYSYWKNEHGPLVKSYSEVLRIKRYVQSHTTGHVLGSSIVEQRGMLPAYEGLAELWWDSIEEIQKVMGSQEGGEALAALALDESKFIDIEKSTIFLSEESEIF